MLAFASCGHLVAYALGSNVPGAVTAQWPRPLYSICDHARATQGRNSNSGTFVALEPACEGRWHRGAFSMNPLSLWDSLNPVLQGEAVASATVLVFALTYVGMAL